MWIFSCLNSAHDVHINGAIKICTQAMQSLIYVGLNMASSSYSGLLLCFHKTQGIFFNLPYQCFLAITNLIPSYRILQARWCLSIIIN